MSKKLAAGELFPALTTPKLGGGTLDLAVPTPGHDWKLLVVYRGKHCPLCTRYLQELNQLLNEFQALGVDVAAVSADTEPRAKAQMAEVSPNYDVGYDLTMDQMKALGLYISGPRNGIDVERPFAEPGLFVINNESKLQLIDISNVPFSRPPLQSILKGLKFMRNLDGDYPVNGSFS